MQSSMLWLPAFLMYYSALADCFPLIPFSLPGQVENRCDFQWMENTELRRIKMMWGISPCNFSNTGSVISLDLNENVMCDTELDSAQGFAKNDPKCDAFVKKIVYAASFQSVVNVTLYHSHPFIQWFPHTHIFPLIVNCCE